VGVGGEIPESIQGPSGVAEGLGVLVALGVLLLTFGSVLAAGLPLLIAACGLGAGLSLIAVLAAVTDVNSVSPTLGSMIGLGAGAAAAAGTERCGKRARRCPDPRGVRPHGGRVRRRRERPVDGGGRSARAAGRGGGAPDGGAARNAWRGIGLIAGHIPGRGG